MGTGVFTFDIAFSEPISIGYVTLRDDSLDVNNGSATKAKRVDGQSDLWKITIEPDSDADVTVVLPSPRLRGPRCRLHQGRHETLNRSELTVPGPAAANTPATGLPHHQRTEQVGETLTVDTSGIDDADGTGNAPSPISGLPEPPTSPGQRGPATRVGGRPGKTIKVRVSFDDDDDNEETLTSEATATVIAAVTPLTAGFQDAPDKHLGTGVFTFEIAFSEPHLHQLQDPAGRLPGSYQRLGDQGQADGWSERPVGDNGRAGLRRRRDRRPAHHRGLRGPRCRLHPGTARNSPTGLS